MAKRSGQWARVTLDEGVAQQKTRDVDVLALALHLDVPLWSNDRDFEDTGVSRFITAELLAILFEDRGH